MFNISEMTKKGRMTSDTTGKTTGQTQPSERPLSFRGQFGLTLRAAIFVFSGVASLVGNFRRLLLAGLGSSTEVRVCAESLFVLCCFR
ncbi:hypothetical protein BaRGS_00039346 [Batillaria attramentaria]|uniref:CASP-like protein n=1 Tax=Batillaria attramentaria TaxID=370345 RepID=A0ABD0J3Y6_9CAEN